MWCTPYLCFHSAPTSFEGKGLLAVELPGEPWKGHAADPSLLWPHRPCSPLPLLGSSPSLPSNLPEGPHSNTDRPGRPRSSPTFSEVLTPTPTVRAALRDVRTSRVPELSHREARRTLVGALESPSLSISTFGHATAVQRRHSCQIMGSLSRCEPRSEEAWGTKPAPWPTSTKSVTVTMAQLAMT